MHQPKILDVSGAISRSHPARGRRPARRPANASNFAPRARSVGDGKKSQNRRNKVRLIQQLSAVAMAPNG